MKHPAMATWGFATYSLKPIYKYAIVDVMLEGILINTRAGDNNMASGMEGGFASHDKYQTFH